MKNQTEPFREGKIWSDENHPYLATQEDINRYLREMRASWRGRVRQRPMEDVELYAGRADGERSPGD